MLECFPYAEPWVRSPDLRKLDAVVHACNSNTPEAEAGGSETQGHPQLHSYLEVSLGYMRPCFKKRGEQKHGDTVAVGGQGRKAIGAWNIRAAQHWAE